MMLVPAHKNNFINDFLSDPFDMGFFGMPSNQRKTVPTLMKTDIKETDKAYELNIELPGFKKEDLHIELNEGYLAIDAFVQSSSEESTEDGTFIRKERFSGNCSRSFYVGEDISEDEIHARFEDGILKICLPKKQPVPPEETKRLISIDD